MEVSFPLAGKKRTLQKRLPAVNQDAVLFKKKERTVPPKNRSTHRKQDDTDKVPAVQFRSGICTVTAIVTGGFNYLYPAILVSLHAVEILG